MLQSLKGSDWDTLWQRRWPFWSFQIFKLMATHVTITDPYSGYSRSMGQISSHWGSAECTVPLRHWPSEAHRSPPPVAEAHWGCWGAGPPHCSHGSSRRRSWGCRGSSASLSWRCTAMLERETTRCGQVQHVLIVVMQWENPNVQLPPAPPETRYQETDSAWEDEGPQEVTLKGCYSTCDS